MVKSDPKVGAVTQELQETLVNVEREVTQGMMGLWVLLVWQDLKVNKESVVW